MPEIVEQLTDFEDEDLSLKFTSKIGDRAADQAFADLEASFGQNAAPEENAQQPIEQPEEKSIGQKAVGVAKDIGEGIIEAPLQIAGGAIDAFNEASDITKELSDWLDENVVDLTIGEKTEENIFKLPTTAKADSTTGNMLRGISQFVTGFIGAGKLLKPVQPATTAGKLGKAAGQGAIADFAAFDPHEERLSNLIESSPALQNPVTEFLAADPDDNAAEGRLKNSVEGLGLGVAVDSLMMGLKSVRKARIAKAQATPAKDPGLTEVLEKDVNPDEIRQLLGEKPKAEPKPTLDGGVDIDAEDVVAAQDRPVSVEEGEVFINFGRIDSPDDVKAVMRDLADAGKDEIDEARRGVRSWEATKLSAEQENAVDLLMQRRARGKATGFNAEESLAVRELWVKSTDKVQELAKSAAANPSEANLFAFRKMLAVHNTIQKEVIAARTETARALNAWAIPAGSSKEVARNIDDLLSKFGGNKNSQQLAERINALSDAGMSAELDKFVEGSAWAKTGNAIAQVWINSLLSGPHTHMRNMISQSAVIGQQLYERKAAELITQSVGREGVAMGEGSAMMYGLTQGFKDALRVSAKGRQIAKAAANKALKGDPKAAKELLASNADEFGTVYQAAATGKTGIGVGKVELPRTGALSAETMGVNPDTFAGRALDFIDTATQIPGKALGVEDELFKTIGYRMELHAQALRKATAEVNAGDIKPDELKDRMADILENPSEEIRLSSMDSALYMTFTNKPAEVPMAVVKGIAKVPVLGRIVMPFRRTPVNIATYTFERTPLAPLVRTWREDVLAGGARRDIAMAKFGTGNTILLAMADLAMNGDITGEGPADPKQRAAERRRGIQHSSVRVRTGSGEKDFRYFNYRGMEPVATSMGLAANMVDILQHTDWEDDQAEVDELVIAASMAIANQVTSQQYMSGVSEFFNALSDPQRYGERWWNRLAGSVVPTGVAQIARGQDPYLRAVSDMTGAMKARTPGLSKELPFRRDVWGRKIDRRSGLGDLYDAMSPVYSKKYKSEPIDEELNRLEKWVSKPGKNSSFTVDGSRDSATINLERYPEAYERFVELSGNALSESQFGAPIDVSGKGAKDALNDLVSGNHPLSQVYQMYTDGPDGGKADFIQKFMTKYRQAAKPVLLEEFPDLKAEVERKVSEKQSKVMF